MQFNLLSIVLSLYLSGQLTAQSSNSYRVVPELKHCEHHILETPEFERRDIRHDPPVEIAKQFVAKKFNFFDGQDYIVKDSYTSANGVTHTYIKQIINGRQVANGDMNINVDRSGNVISYGSSFRRANRGRSAEFEDENPGNVVDAVSALFKHINKDMGIKKEDIVVKEGRSGDEPVIIENIPAAKDGITAVPTYIQDGSDEVKLVWNIEADLENNWFNVFVDSKTNEIISLNDWIHKASYNVYAIPTNDPEDGKRTIVTQQGTKTASPLGWHDQGDGKTFTTTTGNNVIALDNRKPTKRWNNQPRAKGGKDLKFDFPIDFTKQPGDSINAAITNLFYVNNWYHDYLYAHGFNEIAGNFQQNNFDKGGLGGDPVRAQAQDGADKDNADFAAPPDGKIPRMRMFTFTETNPERDGDFDNGIIIHEYTHGVSTRLTGGPSNSDCLNTLESAGMGEGWSDAFANLLRQREDWDRSQDLPMGAYVNNGKTIRQYLYSTSLKTNPDLFSSIDKPEYAEEHSIGAVWAEILYEVYWNLREHASFTTDLLSGDYKHGNTLFARLLIDSMKLQPCNPTFIDARDAIILADKVLTNGNFKCDLWKGFAKRGLGVDAKIQGRKHIDGFKLPEGC